MPATIEQIDAALFTLVSGASLFVTKSRRLKFYGEVPPEDQPALYLAAGNMNPRMGQGTPGMPYKWTLVRKLWLYANTGNDDSLIPSSIMNPILNSVLAALKPRTPGDRQTLSGLVYNVIVSGSIQTDEGLLGPQAVAVIPVEILTGEL